MYTKDDKNSTDAVKPAPSGTEDRDPQRSNRAFAGILVVVVGSLLLARQAGVEFPHWLFNAGPIMMVIGLYIGFRSNFRNWAWIIVGGIGTLILMSNIVDISIHQFIWPLIIISVGLVLIFKPKRDKNNHWKNWGNMGVEEQTGEGFIDSTAIFGAIKKNVISKNFIGGDITSIFGGVELNLGQADINGRANLDLTHIFGGAKIIVPADWTIKTDDVVCIFGGLDDKRKMISNNPDPNKVLVLHGTCIFGGIDIKSY